MRCRIVAAGSCRTQWPRRANRRKELSNLRPHNCLPRAIAIALALCNCTTETCPRDDGAPAASASSGKEVECPREAQASSTAATVPIQRPSLPKAFVSARTPHAPKTSCTLNGILHKRIFQPNLACEWKSAQKRHWGRKSPSNQITVRFAPGAVATDVAQGVHARSIELPLNEMEPYTLHFRSDEAAIAAISALLCSRSVRFASMVLLSHEDDDEPIDSWCDPEDRGKGR